MADIELVIKIPKELYESYKGRPPMLGDAGMDMIAQAIANGTPITKKHGRLIDADALVATLGISDRDIYCKAVIEEDAPTIIEVDKAESN